MKLTTTTFVSVDGVMQGIGGPDEDRRGGFERGGWTTPLWDQDAGTFLEDIYQRADAFLFGRQTYEIFAGSWGAMPDPSINPIGTALNSRPKYVASTTLTDPQWADTTVLSGDVAAAIGELKATAGAELQVHGSGALIRWLLDNDLVDEINLLIFPVVVGQGTRLFPDTGPDRQRAARRRGTACRRGRRTRRRGLNRYVSRDGTPCVPGPLREGCRGGGGVLRSSRLPRALQDAWPRRLAGLHRASP
jgi:dihydrofolate reductase